MYKNLQNLMGYFDFTLLANLLIFRNKCLSYNNSETLMVDFEPKPFQIQDFLRC